MTLTQLAQKHNLEPESAKAFLREWLDMQRVIANRVSDVSGRQQLFFGKPADWNQNIFAVTPLIARPNMEDL